MIHVIILVSEEARICPACHQMLRMSGLAYSQTCAQDAITWEGRQILGLDKTPQRTLQYPLLAAPTKSILVPRIVAILKPAGLSCLPPRNKYH